jgi:peptidoglycan/LPS O-acetylase OafA/YrhL
LGLLRILLAICVLFGHAGRPFAHFLWLDADLAVEIFFVISGFYMQLILSTKYTEAKLGKTWVSQFYKARYFRLLPTYLAWSVLVAVAGLLLPTSTPYAIWTYVWQLPNTAGNFLFKLFLCFTNTTMVFQDVTMFFAAHGSAIHWSGNFRNSDVLLYRGLTVPPAWSLGIELSFYFLAPYLLKLRSHWLLLASCLGLALKVVAIQSLHLGDPWTYRFFPFELGYFLLGALAFRYRHTLENLLPNLLPKHIAQYFVYPFVIVFAALRVPVPLPTLVYPLVLAAALPFLFRVTASLKTDRWIGELSYPFYVFHYFLAGCARFIAAHWLHTSGSSVAWIALSLTLPLSVIALTLETRFIEPWRSRLATPATKPEPLHFHATKELNAV